MSVSWLLRWPPHDHHSARQAWFAGQGHRAWATNPTTQLGVVRLLTNPAVTRGAVNGVTAIQTLSGAVSHPNHGFWPLDRSVPSLLAGSASIVQGHRQRTDLLLFRHAVERRGKLVTFDAALRTLATAESRNHIVVLEE